MRGKVALYILLRCLCFRIIKINHYTRVLEQPTEKPTVEKSSAAKEPTDPPHKPEDVQGGGVSADEEHLDPVTKGKC